MSIEQKKYKRLRKELQFVQSELEYVLEVLSEWHFVFEEYRRDYCKRKGIDLDQLNKESSKKVEQLIPKPVKKDNGVVSYNNKKDKDIFKKLYKKIARKLHPDLGGDEKEFQEVTSAMQEKNFEKILDVCIRDTATRSLLSILCQTNHKHLDGEVDVYRRILFSHRLL